MRKIFIKIFNKRKNEKIMTTLDWLKGINRYEYFKFIYEVYKQAWKDGYKNENDTLYNLYREAGYSFENFETEFEKIKS